MTLDEIRAKLEQDQYPSWQAFAADLLEKMSQPGVDRPIPSSAPTRAAEAP